MPNPTRKTPRLRIPSKKSPEAAPSPRPSRVPIVAVLCGLGLVALAGVLIAATRPRRVPAPKPVVNVVPVATAEIPVKKVPPLSWFSGVVGVPIADVEKPETLRRPSIETPPAMPAHAPKKAAVVKAKVVKPVVVKLPPGLPVKRIHKYSSGDLQHQLGTAPLLMLDRTAGRKESIQMVHANLATPVSKDITLALLDRRPDLAGLPLRRGGACRKTPDAARQLEVAASELHGVDPTTLPAKFKANKDWLRAARVPALMQVLMVEPEATRDILARHLADAEGVPASAALAQMALYDPAPEVRRSAITSLDKRPANEYRALLLRGFNSPWPVVAEHAAEALVALHRTDAVPTLLALLDAPDPRLPYVKGNGPVRYVREVVRIHHKLNCLLCHPPSFRSNDLVRAPVPPLHEPRVAAVTGGYFGNSAPIKKETFVRADITYLKQDYSVMLLSAKTGILAPAQRYDVFVRERFATNADLAAAAVLQSAGLTDRQKALLFALRELTGEAPGAWGGNWNRFAKEQMRAARDKRKKQVAPWN